MTENTITLKLAKITLGKNDILYVQPSPESHADLELMQAVHKAFRQLTKGIKHPALIDMTNVKSMDYDSRKYIAEETGDIISAVALITKSAIGRVVGNFFIGINKPDYPARLFSNENEAIIWLKEISDKK